MSANLLSFFQSVAQNGAVGMGFGPNGTTLFPVGGFGPNNAPGGNGNTSATGSASANANNGANGIDINTGSAAATNVGNANTAHTGGNVNGLSGGSYSQNMPFMPGGLGLNFGTPNIGSIFNNNNSATTTTNIGGSSTNPGGSANTGRTSSTSFTSFFQSITTAGTNGNGNGNSTTSNGTAGNPQSSDAPSPAAHAHNTQPHDHGPAQGPSNHANFDHTTTRDEPASRAHFDVHFVYGDTADREPVCEACGGESFDLWY
ncbi:hypothetical protein I302_101777 [Kwoniella bestiolae CBS 10118]|uniref:Uncharacterized protein n=1 Tax=Kwoniella bestiolae CBS 10118 TaxID=1296100 RepID=A0A1B9GD75_9TREE|nr:hypothetical protein I302_00457 [Kwoniella bestiolae CBS 10118]OCF28966.1 hypothetical protein I302_00457 [Kwoniella bestiolae CBS 10118]